jgi:hypothetical protein
MGVLEIINTSSSNNITHNRSMACKCDSSYIGIYHHRTTNFSYT